MGKIKGWTKIKEMKWRNDKTYQDLEITNNGNVYVVNKKFFNNKKRAIDYAIKIMRENPNG